MTFQCFSGRDKQRFENNEEKKRQTLQCTGSKKAGVVVAVAVAVLLVVVVVVVVVVILVLVKTLSQKS